MDREIEEEIASHLAEATDEYLRQGLPPEEARQASLRRFGSVARTKEVYRNVGSFMWVEDVGRDLRHALRTLRKSPSYTTAAAATLMLAIGANTTMFSVVNAVLLRPLPYQSAEQLVMLWTEDPTQNIREGRSSLSDVERWRSGTQSFADMATFDSVGMTLMGAEGAERIAGASISPNLLSLLGVRPGLGRSFTLAEGEQDDRVVLISDRFWRARFGGSHDALGAILVLNGVPCRIIGVLPPDVRVARLDADVWAPHGTRQITPDSQTWFVIGRLRSGVTFDQAQAEMTTIARRLSDQLPAVDKSRGISVVPLSLYMVGPQTRVALWMLGWAVLCVFLIAAANVTSLSLARGVARGREMAIRVALGASAGRIMRQSLTEGILLAAVSGVMGTLLAVGAIRLICVFGPGTLPRLNEMSLDLRSVGWTLAISLLAGLLVGLAPAVATFRRDLRPSGEESGRSVSGGAAIRRIRRALVVAEFALAIVLLVGAGLLLRSWWFVINIDPGFSPRRVLVMEVSAPPAFEAPQQRADLYRRVLDQVQAVPGVERAGIIGDLFISNSREQIVTVERNGGTVSERLRFAVDEVSPGFFKTLATPLLRGRTFSTGDEPAAAPIAIINDAMARRSWPGRDPVGRRLKLGPQGSKAPWYTVVGVVADMRRQGLERDTFPQIFVPLAQSAPRSVDLFVRTSSGDPLSMAGALRAAVHRAEQGAPIFGVASLEQQFGTFLARRRFETSLLTGFSILALLMAAVGIYGLVQYSIVTRTPEIRLRVAVGAQAGDIFRMVMAEGLMLSLTGLALGLVGAVWLGRGGSNLLFGVDAGDCLTFTSVSLLLTVVAVAACYFPARRAMAIDPITALRV
jgi:putative ABC transport system permease protein